MASQRFRKYGIHTLRVAILICIACLMRAEHRDFLASSTAVNLELTTVRSFFPTATSLANNTTDDRVDVRDSNNQLLGYALQTSPNSDHILGFSGPTNVVIAFSPDDDVLGIQILSSGDTRDHVRQVESDSPFMNALNSVQRDEVAQHEYDSVSGATLTSLAIREAIAFRMGKESVGSLRFPEPPKITAIQAVFPSAAEIKQEGISSIYRVKDSNGQILGSILRTSPAADNTIGYQGPTDAFVAFGPSFPESSQVLGIAVGETFDNDPYVGYVRDDSYFRKSFNDFDLNTLASLDLMEAQIEGVSGATMTSMAVADGLIVAAKTRLAETQKAKAKTPPTWYSFLSPTDLGTLFVILVGAVIGMTRVRGHKRVNLIWKIILVCYLGLIAGNLLSQAMFVGWAQNGIPIQNAFGLFCLAIAAFTLPIFTRRNIYCTHLCPHGALQQLVKRRLPWQPKLWPWLKTLLSLLPALLLLWCVVVGMSGLGFSLVDIEPFDAYVFRIAGWATIVVAVIGLVASLFVPMAYCRYGCPTGALLEFLRFNAKSGDWTARDWVAVGFLFVAIVMRVS